MRVRLNHFSFFLLPLIFCRLAFFVIEGGEDFSRL
jgi:hypothetical protein